MLGRVVLCARVAKSTSRRRIAFKTTFTSRLPRKKDPVFPSFRSGITSDDVGGNEFLSTLFSLTSKCDFLAGSLKENVQI